MPRWPSAELKPPGPRSARITGILWWLLLALAVWAVAGGVWRSAEAILHPTGFDRVGFAVREADYSCVMVTPASNLARTAWPDEIVPIIGGCVVQVDGKRVAPTASRDMIGSLLDGPVGSRVKLRLDNQFGEQVDAEFVRAAPARWVDVGVLAIDTLAAVLYLAVALLLWRRRQLDPVARRMSFAFLLIAHVGTGAMGFWGASQMHYVLAGIGVLLMIVTLPAYPNGVYVPRAARWLRVFVPFAPVAALASIFALPLMILLAAGLTLLLLILLAAGLLLLLVRYRQMPEGLEKQQIKWVAFGLSAGFFLMFVGFVIKISVNPITTNLHTFALLTGIADVVGELGFALIPAGVGVSLLEYRLNDADAAVGKSLGYAIVTVVVGAVWAVVQLVVSDYAKKLAGDPMATTAITTVFAALVFTPARAYVLAWTEKKFQPALVHLRKLPEKLVRWQACESPDELAKAALADLVPGVGAAYAAVLGDDGRQWRVLAAHGIEPDKAAALLAAERTLEQRNDPFPIRRELGDQLGQPDLLAIGPRSDGAGFTRDEKSAIALIVEPLSNAIEAAALRERHIIKVEDSLAGIDQRLGRLEVKLAPLGGRPPKRR